MKEMNGLCHLQGLEFSLDTAVFMHITVLTPTVSHFFETFSQKLFLRKGVRRDNWELVFEVNDAGTYQQFDGKKHRRLCNLRMGWRCRESVCLETIKYFIPPPHPLEEPALLGKGSNSDPIVLEVPTFEYTNKPAFTRKYMK